MNLHAFFISSLVAACLGSSALADTLSTTPPTESSLHLDYKASEIACPTSDRFADEVSSKLGFVPWRAESADRLVVRIRRDGDEAVASLELPNGDSKVLRNPTCEALFPALVATVTVAIDTRSQPKGNDSYAPYAPPAPPPEAIASSPTHSRVHIRSSEAGVIVSRITSRAALAGSNGATAAGISWEELCIAPCSFELEPGLRELMISGKGPAASRKLSLSGGTDTYLVAKPGSTGLVYGGYAVATLGLTSALMGGIFMLVGETNYDTGETHIPGWTYPALIGGLGATGLGLGMMYKGQSHLDEESKGQQGTMVQRAVSLSGSF